MSTAGVGACRGRSAGSFALAVVTLVGSAAFTASLVSCNGSPVYGADFWSAADSDFLSNGAGSSRTVAVPESFCCEATIAGCAGADGALAATTGSFAGAAGLVAGAFVTATEGGGAVASVATSGCVAGTVGCGLGLTGVASWLIGARGPSSTVITYGRGVAGA